MSEDPIRKYSFAVEEYERAFKKILDLESIISEVNMNLIRKPHVFMISNISVKFPADISHRTDVFNLNANEWSSAELLAEAMIDFHNKRKAVKNAW